MTVLLILLSVVLWHQGGFWSCLFWWTKEMDATLENVIMFGVFFAWLGPFAFLLGGSFYFMGKINIDTVVFRKRGAP